MKNKTLENKTDTQTSLSPHQAERAEAQETPVLQPGPLGGTLARPGREATVRAQAASLNRATAGRTLHRLQRQYGNRYVQRVVARRQGGAEGFRLDDETAGRINRARGRGQPLKPTVQKQMSTALGHDFSGVRVHTDPEADELNQQLQAKAFTTGRDIFFKRGAYDPASSGGRELIAHELTHVVQQSSGRVSSGGSGMTGRPAGDAFEHDGDDIGRTVPKKGETNTTGQTTHYKPWKVTAPNRVEHTEKGGKRGGCWAGCGRKSTRGTHARRAAEVRQRKGGDGWAKETNYKDVGVQGIIYATSQVTDKTEVEALLGKIRAGMGGTLKKIVRIFTGTHGSPEGYLLTEKEFFKEDKWLEEKLVEAVEVGPDTPANKWEEKLSKKVISILAWCHSAKWQDLLKYNK